MSVTCLPAPLTGMRDGTHGTGIATTPSEAAATKNEEITELAMDRASVQRTRIGGSYNVSACLAVEEKVRYGPVESH